MDIKNLLKLLNEKQVEFVIIGATAFPIHGYSRATIDTDLFIRSTNENATKVLAALKEFGYDVSDLSVDDLIENKVLIREYVVATDIHPFVQGVSFDEIWGNRVKADFDGVQVAFASLEGLIKMKKAANRPKDIEDLKVLEAILDKKEKPLSE